MSTSDFTTTILVDQTPKEAFETINNVRGWWSEEIEGGTEKLNDEFRYHYEDVHRCEMKLTEVVPEKKVVWLVLDNYFKFTNDKSEWIGNTITFDISEKNGKTQIVFTQDGLVPEYECFEICRDAWTNYIQKSLYSLITTGEGQPNATGKPQTEHEKELSKCTDTNLQIITSYAINQIKPKIDMSDYQKSISVNKPIKEVYAAITEHIPDWWSTDFAGTAAGTSDSFNIAFGETRKTFKIEEAIPDEKVIWKCVRAYIDMASLKNKAEWEGTRIIWKLSTENEGTTLNFLHEGLNRNFECYNVCEEGWNQFLTSLELYLTTGTGDPFLKADKKAMASDPV